MAIASIFRPSLDSLIQNKIPFTALPNSLIHHGELGLKPRDASVLNYLLSKPAEWTICPTAIATALYISVSTVRRALTFLVKLGIAGYQRFADGKTKWFVKLPDDLKQKPQHQKPQVAKPQRVKSDVLESNDLSENIKETTNTAVVVSLPDYVNKTETVKTELGALDAKLQASVLKTLASAMLCAGKVKNPTAYLLGLVRNASKGSFSLPTPPKSAPPVDKALVLRGLHQDLAALRQLYALSGTKALVPQIRELETQLSIASSAK